MPATPASLRPNGPDSRRPRRPALRRAVLAGLAFLALSRALPAQDAGRLISPGKLSQAHAAYGAHDDCDKCHTPGTKNVEPKCLACHQELARRISAGRGFHKDKKTGCATCHPDHQGADFAMIDWKPKAFDHGDAGYLLTGKHAVVRDCEKCHNARSSPPVKLGTSYLVRDTRCQGCHEDVHKGQLKQGCEACHTLDVPLKEPRFDHAKAAYRPKGAHLPLACEKCHPGKKWTGLKYAACADCHRDNHAPSLGKKCETCHSDASWKVGAQDHSKTKLPLKDKHLGLKCEKCHTNGRLGKLPGGSACKDCHAAGDAHKGQFAGDCGACHDAKSFKKASVDHAATRYPLAGKHAAVACVKCHTPASGTKVVRYRPLGMGCADCHKDVHRGQFKKSCESCHSVKGFDRATSGFAHDRDSTYRLEGTHASTKCEACHKSESAAFPTGAGEAVRYRPIAAACRTCHADEHGGQLSLDCATCHTMVHFKPAPGFSHQKTRYPLGPLHSGVACDKCHSRPVTPVLGGALSPVRYKPLGVTCAACHQSTEHAKAEFPLTGRHVALGCDACHTAKAPRLKSGRPSGAGAPAEKDCQICHRDPHQGSLKDPCASCHTTAGWSTGIGFHKLTRFPLEGRHLVTPCAACHINGAIQGTPKDCYACHWIRSQDDPYRTRLGAQCEDCHRPTSWTAVSWDHGARTGMPLNARHRTLACESCHKDRSFRGTTPDCYSCHAQDYAKAQNPNHATAGFPTTCQICHLPSDSSFAQGRFDHNAGYVLVGAHATQPCAACHINRVYKGTARDCYGCHKTNYDRTTNPNHAAAGFPTTCETCHRATDPTWTQGSFNHASSYALVGMHAAQPCAACHVNRVYKGTARDCFGCHRANYTQTKNPNHAAAGLPTTCETCHRATDPTWTQGSFNHALSYSLVGVHATQPCAACHINGLFKGTSRDCFGCHQANYNQTKKPNHLTAGFPTACDSCHRATDPTWTQGSFNHASTYALAGVHATQPCAACHVNGIYKGTSRDCYGCHQANYTQAKNPNHLTSGFPTTCVSCHRATDATWTQGLFNHASSYALVGVHATQPCAACHANGIYKGTPRDCYSCHRTLYDRTTKPNHAAAGYSTACDQCHKATDATWTQATFNHASTYALVGVHATLACTACHLNGVYKGTPRDCYSCHRTLYDRTTNPNHAAAGYSTACDQCHKATDATWTQATFSHTWFPITSGRHAGNVCSACHTDPNNYKIFNCLACHPRSSIDSHHASVKGYIYNSVNCYACHPNGVAGAPRPVPSLPPPMPVAHHEGQIHF
jgi:hypothetical protein